MGNSCSSPADDPSRKNHEPARTGVDGVDWYHFFAHVIADNRQDANDYEAIVAKCDKNDLKAKDKTGLPLLALAKDKLGWFR